MARWGAALRSRAAGSKQDESRCSAVHKQGAYRVFGARLVLIADGHGMPCPYNCTKRWRRNAEEDPRTKTASARYKFWWLDFVASIASGTWSAISRP